MDKNELIRLLATMNTGELHEIYSLIQQYTASAETIDSLKRVFDSNHLIEFVTEDGNMILADKFIGATPLGERTVRVQFGILGIVCDYQLQVDIDVTKKWVLNSKMPFYDFGILPAPSCIVKLPETENGSPKQIPFVPIKGLSVCKLVHNCYNTEASGTSIESNTMSLLNKIKNKINKHDVPEEKITHEPNYIDNPPMASQSVNHIKEEESVLPEPYAKLAKVQVALGLTDKWVNKDSSHRIVFNVSHSFTHKDDSTTTKSTNNYSFVFDSSEWRDEQKYYYLSSGGSDKKGVYSIVKPDDFINGSVTWDHNRKNLVITNEDKTYIIRITYMKDSTIVDLDGDSRGIPNVFNNLEQQCNL